MLSKIAPLGFVLIAIVMVLATINAQQQTLVSAHVMSSSGTVEIQRRAQGQATLTNISYQVNDELVAGDVIKTHRGGRMVLGLSDGSQAIISENTTVEITDLSQSPRTIFNLLRGKTRIKIEKVGGRPNPYRVNTPTAVIAVRGTLFDVFASDSETQVFVHEGEVAVSNLRVPDRPVILTPGNRTRVRETQEPEQPSHFQPGRNNDNFKPPTPPDKGRDGSFDRDARDARGSGPGSNQGHSTGQLSGMPNGQPTGQPQSGPAPPPSGPKKP